MNYLSYKTMMYYICTLAVRMFLYVSQIIFIFESDRDSALLPMDHPNIGMCHNNVLHAWNKIARMDGTVLVFPNEPTTQ